MNKTLSILKHKKQRLKVVCKEGLSGYKSWLNYCDLITYFKCKYKDYLLIF